MQLSEAASGSLEPAEDGSAHVSGPVAKKPRRENDWLQRTQSTQALEQHLNLDQLQHLILDYYLAEADAHTSRSHTPDYDQALQF